MPDALPEVVVMASGCLGLISFPRLPGRVTREELDERYLTLVPALSEHPGIGFVLVRSATEGAVALGWPELEEVAAFEELVGSHGGLGGPQAHPFVLAQSRLRMPEDEIVGAEHMHRVMRGWLAELGYEAYRDLVAATP